jgi:hypothetical protein
MTSASYKKGGGGNKDMAAKMHGQPSLNIHLKRSNEVLLRSIFLTRTVRQLWIPSASFWCVRRWNSNIIKQIFPRTLGNSWQICCLLQSTGTISLKISSMLREALPAPDSCIGHCYPMNCSKPHQELSHTGYVVQSQENHTWFHKVK